MGANVYWRPIGKGRCITPGLRSKFASALNLPRQLDADDIQFLRGLAAGEEDFKEAVDELIEAIEKHGAVEVYAEY